MVKPSARAQEKGVTDRSSVINFPKNVLKITPKNYLKKCPRDGDWDLNPDF